MPSFRERLDAAEALLLQAQARPKGDRAQPLAVVADLLSDLITDLDAAHRATPGARDNSSPSTADAPPQRKNQN